ncbi:Serpin (serine protease inhibitor) [Popillia japonica]|uniref:Serpin (Serine protease inhibitor) n=1 Tax=Popillia japonica TaxID=7064 RepID=A0AAW1KNB0_POPJA
MRHALELLDINLAAIGYRSLMEMLNSIDDVTFHIANKVFVHSQCILKEKFRTIAREYFLTEIESITFAPDNISAAKKINDWVENETNKKIKNVIQPHDLNSDTRSVLINAVYFKGNWLKQFNPKFTSRDKFYLNDTDSIDCDMMYAEDGFFYGVDHDLDAQIVKLLYKNTNLSLIIILPKTNTGINKLEKKLATKDLRDLNRKLHYSDVVLSLPKFKVETTIYSDVVLSLPKFKVETTIELNEPLRELGLDVIFQRQDAFPHMLDSGLDVIFQRQDAFPHMLDSVAPIHVSKVIQKAFIEVNETGTEALLKSMKRELRLQQLQI